MIKTHKTKEVAIIGAGPAGIAAAVQLKQYGFDPLLFGGDLQGSLLKNAWRIDNYLGIDPGVSGLELLSYFESHLKKHSIQKIQSKVQLLTYDSKNRSFVVKTDDSSYVVDKVIVASGTKPKPLDDDLHADITPYLFYDCFPLLQKYKKTIVIIGGGDVAFDNALNLSKNNTVFICNKSNFTTASQVLINEVQKNNNITYFNEYMFRKVTLDSAEKNLEFIFLNSKKDVSIKANYFLVVIGRLPQKDFYSDDLLNIEENLIRKGQLILAGDVKNGIYRQVAIAAADGIKAAMVILHDQ